MFELVMESMKITREIKGLSKVKPDRLYNVENLYFNLMLLQSRVCLLFSTSTRR